MQGLRRKSQGLSPKRKLSAVGLSLSLVTGLLASVLGLVLGGGTAYAGSVSTTYSCDAPIIGLVSLSGVTVSETSTPPTVIPIADGNVGTTVTETPNVSATFPAGLLNEAWAAGQTELAITAATLNIDGSGQVTPLAQAATGATLPLVIPLTGTTGPRVGTNSDTPVSITFSPLTWTYGSSTGTASLKPGELDLNALLTFPCYTPGPASAGIGGPSSPAVTPMDTWNVTSPPLAPTVTAQSAAVSHAQCTIINVLNGAGDLGDTIVASTVAVVAPPTAGTATANADGTVSYCNSSGSPATSDTFTFNVKNTGICDPVTNTTSPCPGSPSPQTSNTATVTVAISFNSCSAGAGNPGGGSGGSIGTCSLSQLIILPVEPGQIVLSQASGLPLDVLGSSFCTATPTVAGITLNGQPQAACGVMSPMTVTNATGLDSGWTLTGQVTDFLDPATPLVTSCDTTATYNNHCIPGGNLAWSPIAAVASGIVPGDTALVTAGAVVAPPGVTNPTTSLNPEFGGAAVQPNPVVEPAPHAGLNSAPATLCITASGRAGGTFVCSAGLELMIPASAAEPGVDAHIGAPAYQATLTLTLS